MIYQKTKNYFLPFSVFVFTAAMLSIVQVIVDNPIIILERFFKGGGWVEIFIISMYGAFVTHKMIDPKTAINWRRYSWTIFTIAFFGQLLLGLLGFEKFMMTGELHIPVPMVIFGGAVHKLEITFMTFLLLITIILSGPAWCSQLCYFGALDNIAAKHKSNTKPIKNKMAIKSSILLLVIIIALLLRWMNVTVFWTATLSLAFGFIGLLIILFVSKRKGKMYHCILYCPIGTIVNYSRFINPFRMYINNSCTMCLKCVSYCKYDALNIIDLQNAKPGITCTLCGDCLAACKHNSIKYKFFNLDSEKARNLYLFITISLHAIFLALAKI